MADDKGKPFKGKPKEGGESGPVLGPLEFVFILFFIFIIAAYMGRNIRLFLSGGMGYGWFDALLAFLSSLSPLLLLLSYILSALFVAGIVYTTVQLNRIRAKEREAYYPSVPKPESEVVNQKWQKVLKHIESENENDWRLAILEADIMLDELLDKMGYRGETMGDKLKSVEKSDFTTIDNAWEAHKIRNLVAHEGSDYLLSHREAKRVIELFKTVFDEFYYI